MQIMINTHRHTGTLTPHNRTGSERSTHRGPREVQFESRNMHRLSRLRFVLVLLSSCMQIPQHCLDLTTTASFLVLSNSSPIRHPVIRQLCCPDTDCAVSGDTTKRHKGSSVYTVPFHPLKHFNWTRVNIQKWWRIKTIDRLCGLVVRVLGYSSGGPGSIPGTTKKKM
jgi:hypothetical protein